LIARE
jgi:phage repressor protein C with HTH and peptisase S24 domain